jgi:hypothetical protein
VGEALPSTYLHKESNPSPRPSNIGLLVGSAYLHEGSNPPPFSQCQYLIRCKRHLCIFIRDLVHHSQRTINGMRYESDMNLYFFIRDQTRHPSEILTRTPSEILTRTHYLHTGQIHPVYRIYWYPFLLISWEIKLITAFEQYIELSLHFIFS